MLDRRFREMRQDFGKEFAPIIDDMAKPEIHDWSPKQFPLPVMIESPVVPNGSFQGGGLGVIQGNYPFRCTKRVRPDGTCPNPGEIPLLMWPMASGANSVYEGPKSFNSSSFWPCCKTQQEITKITGRRGTEDMQTLYLEAAAESNKLVREIDRTLTKAVQMWKAASRRELTRVTSEEREQVDMALAYLMQIAYIIFSDLVVIQESRSYTEAVITGAAAAMKGSMPMLPGMKEPTASALDYMRAEFYFRLGNFLTAYSMATHDKDPLLELHRDDTWTKLGLEFIPRGFNTLVNSTWRNIKKMSLLSALAVAVPIIIAMRGYQIGGNGTSTMANMFQGFFSTEKKWTQINALLITVLLEYFLETRMLREDFKDLSEEGKVIDNVVNGAKHYAQKYQSVFSGVTSGVAKYAPDATDFLSKKSGWTSLSGVGSVLGILSQGWEIKNQIDMGKLIFSLSSFSTVLSLGANMYPEFANSSPLMLALHNALWVSTGTYFSSMALSIVNNEQVMLTDVWGWISRFLENEDSIIDVITKALFGDPTGNSTTERGLLSGMPNVSFEEAATFMAEGGPQVVMALLAVLYVADKLSGELPEGAHHMLQEVEQWAPMRAEGFFAQNHSFLPQVDSVLYSQFCESQGNKDCAERLATIKKVRTEVQQGCEHMDETFRARGYRVCDDY